jgi:hypothetical protein
MKKRLTLLCLVFFLILPLLCSCSYGRAIMKLDEGDRAAALFDAVNQVNRASYLLRRETKLSGIIDSIKSEVAIAYDSYFFDLDTDAPSVHLETSADTTVYVSSEPYTTSLRSRSGYRDGKMYVQNSPTSSMYSSVTAEEYFEYLSQSAVSEEKIISALKSAGTQTCQKNGDGSWYAAFNHFPEEELNFLVSSYFDPAVFSFQDTEIQDLIVQIEATKKLELKIMQFTLIFDKNASAQTTIELLEANKKDLPKINLYKFTEVSDLRFLGKLQNKINEKLASNSFSVSMNDTVTVTQFGRETSIFKADYQLDFEAMDNGIAFDYTVVNSNAPEVTYKNQYRDGVLSTTLENTGSFLDDAEMNEYEAHAYLFSLIDAGNLAGAPVSEFIADEKDPNQYTLYIESPSIDKYYHIIGGYPLDAIKTSARIVINLKDGEISEYRYYLTITAEYYNYMVRIVQSNERIFE